MSGPFSGGAFSCRRQDQALTLRKAKTPAFWGIRSIGTAMYDGVTSAYVLKWDTTTKAFVYATKGEKAVTVP